MVYVFMETPVGIYAARNTNVPLQRKTQRSSALCVCLLLRQNIFRITHCNVQAQ